MTMELIKPQAVDKPREPLPDFYSWYAREKHGMPEGWRWASLDCSPDGSPPGMIRVEGVVMPTTEGGRPVWKKRVKGTERTLWIVIANFNAWKRDKALSLDKCVECWGSGEVVTRIIVDKPTEYGPCRVCGGSGKPVK